jgi:hypothetical protein
VVRHADRYYMTGTLPPRLEHELVGTAYPEVRPRNPP